MFDLLRFDNTVRFWVWGQCGDDDAYCYTPYRGEGGWHDPLVEVELYIIGFSCTLGAPPSLPYLFICLLLRVRQVHINSSPGLKLNHFTSKWVAHLRAYLISTSSQPGGFLLLSFSPGCPFMGLLVIEHDFCTSLQQSETIILMPVLMLHWGGTGASLPRNCSCLGRILIEMCLFFWH